MFFSPSVSAIFIFFPNIRFILPSHLPRQMEVWLWLCLLMLIAKFNAFLSFRQPSAATFLVRGRRAFVSAFLSFLNRDFVFLYKLFLPLLKKLVFSTALSSRLPLTRKLPRSSRVKERFFIYCVCFSSQFHLLTHNKYTEIKTSYYLIA